MYYRLPSQITRLVLVFQVNVIIFTRKIFQIIIFFILQIRPIRCLLLESYPESSIPKSFSTNMLMLNQFVSSDLCSKEMFLNCDTYKVVRHKDQVKQKRGCLLIYCEIFTSDYIKESSLMTSRFLLHFFYCTEGFVLSSHNPRAP